MEPFKKHDLSEPRYRKEQYSVINDKFIKEALEKYPNLKKYSKKDINRIITGFHEQIAQAIIDTRDGIELPESLGYILIGSYISKRTDNIDFAKSKKYGVKVTHKNWDTDGRVGKILYSNCSVKYKVKDREIWSFTPCRKFSRDVSKIFRTNWMNYIELGPNERISKLMQKQIDRKEKQKKYVQDRLKTYNEFEI